jgi:hypothetical protein
MRRIVLAALALVLTGCTIGGSGAPPTTAQSRPRPPSTLDEMGQAGGGGY